VTRLLLDTHLVLWWLNGDPGLPQPLVERVQAPQAEVFVSQASLWEMAVKVSIGRLQVDLPELERQVPLQGFLRLPISNAHLLAVAPL
jgi:PIN domain nuclease of toxin-antitoxin system